VTNVSSTDFPGHYPGEDNSWDTEKFRQVCLSAKNALSSSKFPFSSNSTNQLPIQKLKIQIHRKSPLHLTFSLVGTDASIANAFRRILLAEIPTVAIEYVFIFNNTSIIADEILSHRLGLIPLTASTATGRAQFRKLGWYRKPTEDNAEVDAPNDGNTLVLNLNASCVKNPDISKADYTSGAITDPKLLYSNSSIYASELLFRPTGSQSDPSSFGSAHDAVRAANPDILLAKLRPGQEIALEAHAVKGVGSDHAKFSPVATASYRLLPTIEILAPIIGKDAHKFARCFPKGVIGLEKNEEGADEAVVRDASKDTVSRECLRHAEFKDKVKLGRVRDHFLWEIESTGQWEADELFLESVRLLRIKTQAVRRGLSGMAGA
jgi:DNA-directed RNA polymerases I and III subunit RPAC1